MSNYGEIETKHYKIQDEDFDKNKNYIISTYHIEGSNYLNYFLIDNCSNFYKPYNNNYQLGIYQRMNYFSNKKLSNSEIDFIKSISNEPQSLLISILLKLNNRIEDLEKNKNKDIENTYDVKSLIDSINNLKEYCLELHQIGNDQQKILEDICKENLDLKIRLSKLEDSTKIGNYKTINLLPPLPSLSELIKK